MSNIISNNKTDKQYTHKILKLIKGEKEMNEILKETRKQSYKNSNLKTKTKLVFEELGNEELTARELARKMHKKRFIKNC